MMKAGKLGYKIGKMLGEAAIQEGQALKEALSGVPDALQHRDSERWIHAGTVTNIAPFGKIVFECQNAKLMAGVVGGTAFRVNMHGECYQDDALGRTSPHMGSNKCGVYIDQRGADPKEGYNAASSNGNSVTAEFSWETEPNEEGKTVRYKLKFSASRGEKVTCMPVFTIEQVILN
ncbi:hypothetical protein C8Q80DRAFT_1125126 [Daedaleopsis nitida]|nr:hypothetical protein C8Q80DRAFT_1125126 [Daedaleopsis nitida]